MNQPEQFKQIGKVYESDYHLSHCPDCKEVAVSNMIAVVSEWGENNIQNFVVAFCKCGNVFKSTPLNSVEVK